MTRRKLQHKMEAAEARLRLKKTKKVKRMSTLKETTARTEPLPSSNAELTLRDGPLKTS